MPSSSSSPKIILVVDDDEAILNVVKMQLESDGFNVIAVQTAEAAIEVVQITKLFAVLLDMHLRGPKDGFRVLENIKKLQPNLNVIMVTGSHDENEARQTFELGAWDYVTKPIDFKYLKSVLMLLAGPGV